MDMWLVKKCGAYYREGAMGYTDAIESAGIFTHDQASGHIKNCPGVSMVRLDHALGILTRRRDELTAEVSRLDDFILKASAE